METQKANSNNIRAIAIHLPQFHPVPENDEWWGKGFTEWSIVSKGRPLFPNHYQPHLPADLGYYDLRLPETRKAQADLAKSYGIHGFCYYHYWFHGRRILEKPVNDILESGEPDYPFCLCWANDNWTRAMVGGDRSTLLAQTHSHKDDLNHIKSLLPFFKDPRYIRVNGQPLFLVYRTELLPDPAKTAEIWRTEAKKAGIDDLYLVRVESFDAETNPASVGFDASMEFAPDWRTLNTLQLEFRTKWFQFATKLGLLPPTYQNQQITTYDKLIQRMLAKPETHWKQFRCVTPGFDNSARRPEKNAAIFIKSTPKKYQKWLSETIHRTEKRFNGDEQLVFINAWNEWSEGNHLEPDEKHGHQYLESTKQALNAPEDELLESNTTESLTHPKSDCPPKKRKTFKEYYWELLRKKNSATEIFTHIQHWKALKFLDKNR